MIGIGMGDHDPGDPREVSNPDRLEHAHALVVVAAEAGVDHPGYDPGMPDDVRRALAKVRKMTLPEAMTGKATKPNMTLQMARRLASRGLWEDALKYYGDAAKQGPLPAETPLEIAAIHLEMSNPDAALGVLNTLPEALKQDERAKALVAKAQAMKNGQTEKTTPPAVNR
jgi:thioredoxin-like negative regulator of GroEL